MVGSTEEEHSPWRGVLSWGASPRWGVQWGDTHRDGQYSERTLSDGEYSGRTLSDGEYCEVNTHRGGEYSGDREGSLTGAGCTSPTME